jgi:hypothetical protein
MHAREPRGRVGLRRTTVRTYELSGRQPGANRRHTCVYARADPSEPLRAGTRARLAALQAGSTRLGAGALGE